MKIAHAPWDPPLVRDLSSIWFRAQRDPSLIFRRLMAEVFRGAWYMLILQGPGDLILLGCATQWRPRQGCGRRRGGGNDRGTREGVDSTCQRTERGTGYGRLGGCRFDLSKEGGTRYGSIDIFVPEGTDVFVACTFRKKKTPDTSHHASMSLPHPSSFLSTCHATLPQTRHADQRRT
ncbi:hypothetical protein IE53DRAFT_252880 [Violaceomyces palustris]|uniref:Uncharacterized protein n=1 Tax=Violaceomyces palustris TaxID=1673888 RepID=A0ACD0NNH9_9BASI|nr:hypothetical protein IE53DRAFT_252880 [Violaceomyces palustris]